MPPFPSLPAVVWFGPLTDSLLGLASGGLGVCLWLLGINLLHTAETRRYGRFIMAGAILGGAGCMLYAVQAAAAWHAFSPAPFSLAPFSLAPFSLAIAVWKVICAVAALLFLLALATRTPALLRAGAELNATLANAADYRALTQAVHRAQMVIELGPDGTILNANANYLRCMGYTAEEVLGHNLSRLVPREDRESGAYDRFWKELRLGHYQTGVYRRLSKYGDPIWIEASYNPVLDAQGAPVKVVGLLTDISARMRLEKERERQKEALSQSEQFLEETGRLAGVGGWEVDLITGVVTWMPETYRLLGADLSYKPTLEEGLSRYTEESRPLITEAIERSKIDGSGWNLELSLVRMDDRPIWARVVGRAKLLDGKPVCLYGAFQDITAQKQAEDALREQASLLDLCHDAIITRDLDGTIRFWNKGAEEIYGYSKSDALDQVSHFLLDTIFPSPFDQIERFFEERDRWEGELNHITQSGARVVVASRWAMRRDKAGRPIGVMEINSDITERKHAEAALQESSEQQRLLIDGVRDYSIIMLDPLGNVASWNQGAKAIKGYTAEEILGLHLSVFYPKDARAAGKPEQVLAIARTQGRFEESGWRVKKDGSRFWANVVITALFDADRQLRGYCKITRDITEFKQAEEAGEKARIAADLANQAKSDFLANMSHEVRTPVNAIMGMAHLALRAYPDSRQRDYLQKIDAAAKRLLGIMNDILDFSKIEAGKLKVERIQFEIAEVLHNLRYVVGQKAREKHLGLVYEVAPDVPAFFSGDPLRLGQVLINLVNNAVKFTERGEVQVRVDLLSEDTDSVFVRFSVIDRGIGMTALQMQNLFQAFHQADTSFTRQYGGTGLGLAISKQLVELMGGTIGVESEFGVGSTFTFTIRFGRNGGMGTGRAVEHPVFNSVSRILVVDDSENTRDGLVRLLRRHGQDACGADSGEEALTCLIAGVQQRKPFHLVVMDWRLPGINGVEACRRIRSRYELQPAPILLMISAFERHDVSPVSELATFDEFLLKPFEDERLLRMVHTLLQGSRAAAQPAFPGDDDRHPEQNQGQVLDQKYRQNPLQGRTVLLVEDNDLNRELATELLADLGLSVAVAADGQAAVEAVRNSSLDLVLMDIQMPVMDGLAATRAIRADGRFAGLPIIAMTAHAMTGDYERSLAAGMNDHITKPIDPDLLISTLVRWMPAKPVIAAAAAARRLVPEDLPPFNIAAALLRTNNKPLLLRKLLLGFAQQYANASAELKALLAAEKWLEAQRLVHSLKSIAAMLETPRLAQAASALEAALKSGQRSGLEPMIDNLEAALQPAVTAVASLDPPAAIA